MIGAIRHFEVFAGPSRSYPIIASIIIGCVCKIAIFGIKFITIGADKSHEALATSVFYCGKCCIKFLHNFKHFDLSEQTPIKWKTIDNNRYARQRMLASWPTSWSFSYATLIIPELAGVRKKKTSGKGGRLPRFQSSGDSYSVPEFFDLLFPLFFFYTESSNWAIKLSNGVQYSRVIRAQLDGGEQIFRRQSRKSQLSYNWKVHAITKYWRFDTRETRDRSPYKHRGCKNKPLLSAEDRRGRE